jgi:hypothetical protein
MVPYSYAARNSPISTLSHLSGTRYIVYRVSYIMQIMQYYYSAFVAAEKPFTPTGWNRVVCESMCADVQLYYTCMCIYIYTYKVFLVRVRITELILPNGWTDFYDIFCARLCGFLYGLDPHNLTDTTHWPLMNLQLLYYSRRRIWTYRDYTVLTIWDSRRRCYDVLSVDILERRRWKRTDYRAKYASEFKCI